MYTIHISEDLIKYRYNDIIERTKESELMFDESDLEGSATLARLLANSANELATLLTQISRIKDINDLVKEV